jgi:hypothetical protein
MPRMRRHRHLLIPLLVAAIFALLPGAAGAEWFGPDSTIATAECTPSLVEGQTYTEDCLITVEDRMASVEPAIIPTPPTGSVEVDGGTGCTLATVGPATSACHYLTTVTWGTTFPLEIVYSGDETHQSTLSYFLKWAPGYPDYPPEIPARAPPPPPGVVPPGWRPGDPVGEPSDPRILSAPRKLTREHLATFRFAGGEHYETALDRGRFQASGASFSRRVSTGPHVLRVRHAAGGAVASIHWRVLPRHG